LIYPKFWTQYMQRKADEKSLCSCYSAWSYP